MGARDHIRMVEQYGAHNYAPLDVVIAAGRGVWVTDVEGHRYLDMLSAYSALNFGHSNERFIARAVDQLGKLTLTGRAFHHDQFGLFCRDLAELCGMEVVLPMNSGAEAVETAIKAARKWGYESRGIKPGAAEIVCFANNFHGRTLTIVSFSSSPKGREGFGPFTPGFQIIPFGDAKALRAAITQNTAAVLLEPIQGEAGVLLPPDGFLAEVRAICSEHRVLMIADEIQTGLCRTGELFACNHEKVVPDLYIVGKSLGGGIVPISAVVGRKDVMGVFTAGTHGSTFGGNPFACAIAREVMTYIRETKPERRAKELGPHFMSMLQAIQHSPITEVRGRGLFIGVDIDPMWGTGRDACELLKAEGILTKDTRDQSLRLTPPLVIEKTELEWAAERVGRALSRKPARR